MGSPETCPTCGSSQRDVYAGCRILVEGRYSPDPWHNAPPTPPAPADDAGRIVPPCPGCVSEIGRVDPGCVHCGGTGRCPSADDAGGAEASAMREACAKIVDRFHVPRAVKASIVNGAVANLAAAIRALPLPAPATNTRAESVVVWSQVKDGDEVIAGGRRIVMRVYPFRADPHPYESADSPFASVGTPAPDAVEEAAEELCDYLDKTSGGEEWKGSSLVRRLRAALRRAKGGA